MRYIFPNSLLPSLAQIGSALEERFSVEDWHSFGPYLLARIDPADSARLAAG